jgi:3-methyl-2-oxobutanoate hydroxymethyltransferase
MFRLDLGDPGPGRKGWFLLLGNEALTFPLGKAFSYFPQPCIGVGRKEAVMTREEKITIPDILDKKRRGERIVMLTAYDYPFSKIVDEAGVDIILVGDSLGMVVLGYKDTLRVTLDDMVRHTAAVSRGAKRALIVGDMPYLSFHINEDETVRNAGRFIVEGGAEAVKIEGGRKRLPVIRRLIDAEIPVMGHLGLTPQSVNIFGGYRVQGKELDGAKELIADAEALEKAGVFSIVLEGIPAGIAEIISKRLTIPTIGIGAGVSCDGQVLVTYDILGFYRDIVPKFVRRYADIYSTIKDALSQFAADVRSGSFPDDSESYHLPEEVRERLRDEFGMKR